MQRIRVGTSTFGNSFIHLATNKPISQRSCLPSNTATVAHWVYKCTLCTPFTSHLSLLPLPLSYLSWSLRPKNWIGSDCDCNYCAHDNLSQCLSDPQVLDGHINIWWNHVEGERQTFLLASSYFQKQRVGTDLQLWCCNSRATCAHKVPLRSRKLLPPDNRATRRRWQCSSPEAKYRTILPIHYTDMHRLVLLEVLHTWQYPMPGLRWA